MSRLNSKQLHETAKVIRELHIAYTRRPNEGDVSRVLAGYLAGRFARVPRREYPQKYVDDKGNRKKGRIDFLIGNESAGTFIELAILREGDHWSFKPKYASDLWKLERAGSKQSKRVQMLIDLRSNSVTKDFLVGEYRRFWKTTRGKYRRHHVSIVYSGQSEAFQFSLKPKSLPSSNV